MEEDTCCEKGPLESALDGAFSRKTQSASQRPPQELQPRQPDGGELANERHHPGRGRVLDGPGRGTSDYHPTNQQRQREQERGQKKILPSSITISGSPSRRPERREGDHGHRRQERGARGSLVDRQSKSLGWSAETPTLAPAERVRRPSDVSSHRPLRRHSSPHVSSGGSPRRSASSAAAAAMPRSSLSSDAGFFGNFDDSRYWDYAFRLTQRQDIGNQCRECKRPFLVLNEEIAVRRGGRIELRYHKACFSMVADPRSQPASSANVGKFVRSLEGTVAPNDLYRKMRTRGHW